MMSARILKRLAKAHGAKELLNQTYFDEETEAQIAAEE
jgi:hypothetical protein